MSYNTDPNSNNNFNNRIYNCAGSGCEKTGSYLIRLILLKKSAYFCSDCTKYLKDNDLIDSVLDENLGKKRGENNN
jgi:hypothetical protein